MVRPTGKPLNEKVGDLGRGRDDARRRPLAAAVPRRARRSRTTTRSPTPTSPHSNLVLWGDPSSNKVLAKIADKLPITLGRAKACRVGDKTYDASHHVPVLIYPNPLNPKKYVVLNSGFTFREYDYLNNARQVPKLPDWAVVDVSQPVTSCAYPAAFLRRASSMKSGSSKNGNNILRRWRRSVLWKPDA